MVFKCLCLCVDALILACVCWMGFFLQFKVMPSPRQKLEYKWHFCVETKQLCKIQFLINSNALGAGPCCP